MSDLGFQVQIRKLWAVLISIPTCILTWCIFCLMFYCLERSFFGVVVFTRNIAAGFITVILLLFVQALAESALSEEHLRYIAALTDPFGAATANYYTKYWTVAEQNEMALPFKGVIIYNRLIWLGVSALVFLGVYRYFSFSQNALTFSFRKTKATRSIKRNFGGIVIIDLPKVVYNFSFTHHLKMVWRLSIINFKYIVKSWPFISIVLVGLLFILIVLSEIGNIFGTPTLPVTWKMLQSGGVFSLPINICTFLYAGMLVHRAGISRSNHMIDVTPVPNWTLLLSKFLALVKMQLLLLFVIMVSGILFQIYKGYYDFEIGHYLYELYGLELIN